MPAVSAVRLHGPRDARLGEAEVAAGPDDVLVRVTAAGVCGSDLHVFRTGDFVTTFPVTPGHEVAGVVVADAHGFAAGDAVVCDSRVPCRTCPECAAGRPQRCPQLGFLGEVRDGGFAELVAVDRRDLHPAPAGLAPRIAALAEPLAVALHARARLQAVAGRPERVAILGAGPIGLLVALALDDVADVALVEPDRERAALATRASGREARPSADGIRGVDAAFDCAGFAGSLGAALALVRPGGAAVAVALHHGAEPVDANALVAAERVVVGSHVFADELGEALALLAAEPRRFAPVVTDVVGLAELPGRIAAAAEGRHHGQKIVVEPGGAA